MHEGLAGDRHAALCHLCRRLRRVRAGTRALPQVARRYSEREVWRLLLVLGPVPQRCGCGATAEPGARIVRLSFSQGIAASVRAGPTGTEECMGSVAHGFSVQWRDLSRHPADVGM